MNTRNVVLILTALLILVALPLSAQTAVPSTTLCAAQSATATTICLTATTSVVNQTGIYVDGEYELVTLTNSQVLSAGPVQVPVSRGNRGGKGAPTAHVNGAIAWIALTPAASSVPGSNGFSFGTELKDVGACTRASVMYLPHIWVNLAMKRDCSGGTWVNYSDAGDPLNGGVQVLSASGAVQPTSGNYVITLGSAAALTLAAPTSGTQDGAILRIYSSTSFAHVITATGLLYSGAAGVNTLTFAAQKGAGVTLMAYGGKWIVLSNNAVTAG